MHHDDDAFSENNHKYSTSTDNYIGHKMNLFASCSEYKHDEDGSWLGNEFLARCQVVIVILSRNNNMDAKGGVLGQSTILFNAKTIGAC
jgi:hypothetical protein